MMRVAVTSSISLGLVCGLGMWVSVFAGDLGFVLSEGLV